MSAWRTAGVNLARTTRDQYKQVLKISYNELRPGDLVFWSTDPNNPDAIYHVAIWAGGGQIMEASQARRPPAHDLDALGQDDALRGPPVTPARQALLASAHPSARTTESADDHGSKHDVRPFKRQDARMCGRCGWSGGQWL